MTIPTLFFFLYYLFIYLFIYSFIYLYIYLFIYLFVCLFIYLLSKSHGADNYSKTTKARNSKFGQMISLYMNLCTCKFGGATSRGMGHMDPKLVTAKFIT